MSEEAREHTVAELEDMLAKAKAKVEHVEFPKFVDVHESHVVRKPAADGAPAHVSVPLFPHFHVDRDGKVTVQVFDQADADKAARSAEPQPPAVPDDSEMDGE